MGLQEDVDEKRALLDRIIESRTHVPLDEWMVRCDKADGDLALAERALAAHLGLPYAEPEDWRLRPAGTGDPLLICRSLACVLTYLQRTDSLPRMRRVTLRFARCSGCKISRVNDEVIHAHPLYRRGMRSFGAYVILNSDWAQEVMTVNKSHRQFDSTYWERVKHYAFTFQDELIEVLGTGYRTVHDIEYSERDLDPLFR